MTNSSILPLAQGRQWLAALPLALFLAACSTDDSAAPEPVDDGPQPISFTVSGNFAKRPDDAFTRGSLVRYQDEIEALNMAIMARTAEETPQTFWEKETLRHVGTDATTLLGKWATATNYLWPAYNLDFYARLPYSDEARSNETYGSFVYTAPTDNARQHDQMYATALNQERGTVVALNMKHAMAAITFNAKTGSSLYGVTVAGVTICNVVGQATFTYPTASTTAPESDEVDNSPVGTWALGTILTSQVAGIAETPLGTDEQNITKEEGAVILIPQKLTAWDTADGEVTQQQGAYLVIRCRLLYQGMYFAGSETTFADVYVPFGGTFEASKHYTITLTFGLGYTSLGTHNQIVIGVQSTVQDWIAESIYFDKKIL